ncbi:hypothetical protein DFJ77DRAFT_458125 [Powellomyces hirtus]|nr:hypothetical protein DFJ77DRAFT_458125 [Powellomyces hirtus]
MARYVPPHKRNAPVASEASLDDTRTSSITTTTHTGIPSDRKTPSDLDFFHAHLYSRSPLLRSLHTSKAEFEKDPNVERMFVSNRAHSAAITIKPATVTDTPPAAVTNLPSSHFANQFKGAMEEVDMHSGGKLRGRVKRFLDLGCAPGGFSKWVLEQNEMANGMGVTLPPEMDGLPMILEGVLEDDTRYGCIYRDVTDRPAEIRYVHPSKSTIHINNADDDTPQCDLVIAGSIYRDHQTANPDRSGPPPIRARARQLLSFSQILAALRNLQSGGTLVIVSNMKPHLHNLEIVCFLKDHFDTLIPVKPKQVHTIRSSYYLVAMGFDYDKAVRNNTFSRLEDIMTRIAAAEDEKGVEGVLLLDGTENEIVTRWGDYVMEFYHPLWESQIHAIDRKLAGLRSKNNQERRNFRNNNNNANSSYNSNSGGGHGGGQHQQKPCWAFQEGRCHDGDSCRFSHDRSTAAAPPQPQRTNDWRGSR